VLVMLASSMALACILDTRCRICFGVRLVELESDFERCGFGSFLGDFTEPPLLDFLTLRRTSLRDTAVPFEVGEPLDDGFLAATSSSTSVGLSVVMFSFRIEIFRVNESKLLVD